MHPKNLKNPYTPFRKTTRPLGVNLGNLYVQSDSRQNAGWAYFEDGSVFLANKRKYIDHDRLEADMKLLHAFVQQPPSELAHVRADSPLLKRLVLHW